MTRVARHTTIELLDCRRARRSRQRHVNGAHFRSPHRRASFHTVARPVTCRAEALRTPLSSKKHAPRFFSLAAARTFTSAASDAFLRSRCLIVASQRRATPDDAIAVAMRESVAESSRCEAAARALLTARRR